ncbi:MAG: MFS transporter [Sphingomonadales bacterium]|nr:MFS transporter [Sphingomonadales bacterium]
MAISIDNAADAAHAPNHPAAPRMAVIAWLCHNLIVGCLMGTFSVMLASVEARMGVTRAQSSSVGGLVMFGSALMGAFVGPLIARKSLRLLLLAGALASLLGYLLLAFTASYGLYVGSYLLLFGPSMALTGSIGPATLVTRWFGRNRGVAMGLVHVNLIVAVMPLLSNWMLEQYGARSVYLLMATIIGLTLIPATLAARDYPPGAGPATAESDGDAAGSSVAVILRTPAFWALALTAGAVITGIMTMTFNMVPIAQSLGFTRTQGALMASSQSVAGMIGSILFGWVADRLGGGRGLALVSFNMAVLLAVLQLRLPFPAEMAVVALFGLHGAGMIPNITRALARALGRDSFSRAFGLQQAVSVPMTIAGIAAMGQSFTRTGGYQAALLGVAALLAVCSALALWASGQSAGDGQA